MLPHKCLKFILVSSQYVIPFLVWGGGGIADENTIKSAGSDTKQILRENDF